MIRKYRILNGGKYFVENGSQIFLIFQAFSRYITDPSDEIVLWQSKEVSEESIAFPSTTDNSFTPKWVGKYSILIVKFNGECLKQDCVSFIYALIFERMKNGFVKSKPGNVWKHGRI